MSSSWTFGRIGLATSAGGDGLELPPHLPPQWDGDELTLVCDLPAATVADQVVLRDQFIGYDLNPDEPVVPITSVEVPSLDGFYRVQEVNVDDRLGTFVEGGEGSQVTVVARKVPGFTAPLFEVIWSGTLRTNAAGLAIGDVKPIVGIPGSADTYTSDRAAQFATQATANGNVIAYYPDSFAAAVSGASFSYRVDAADFYEAACTIQSTADSGTTWRSVTGRQMTSDADAWRLSNDWVRVSNVSGNLRAEMWDGSSWEATDFVIGIGADPSGVSLLDDWALVDVVRNSPEEVAVSLWLQTGAHAGSVASITLKRGHPIVYGTVTHWDPPSAFGIYRTASEAGTSITGGIKANAANASGNTYFMLSPQTLIKDTTGTSGIWQPAPTYADTFAFGFGVNTTASIGGSGADQTECYFAVTRARQVVVAR